MESCARANAEFSSPKSGEPPLHRAARIGDQASIAALVRDGADINSFFDIGLDPDARERLTTPLMVAAGSGDGATVETVRLLLQLGADPARISGSDTAATFACTGLGWGYRPGGDEARLRVLLDAGTPFPTDPARSNHILCNIAEAGDAARLRLLIEHGLSPCGHWDAVEAQEREREMQVRLSRSAGSHLDMLSSLPPDVRVRLEEQMKNSAEKMSQSRTSAPWSHEIPLFRAAESGNADCVRLLLDAGADLWVRDNSKRTAIYYAASAAVVRLLMAGGLSIDDADDLGWSPLHHAVSDGESALTRIRALIEAGANVNETFDRGYTIFMCAVGSIQRSPEVMRMLIKSGADPHAVSELGYNAFHAAIDVNGEANAEKSVRDTIGYIKELGVDIEHRNNRGLTPLGRAIEEGTGLEVRVLCELGANPNAVCPMHTCGTKACDRPELPLLFHAVDGIGVQKDVKAESLLRAGANPIVKDPEGYSPLVRAVAALCADANDYAGAYALFFSGLKELRHEEMSLPTFREIFIAEVSTPLRSFVEQFAAQIPVSDSSEFSNEWRTERLNCIVSLCVYEAWVLHSNR